MASMREARRKGKKRLGKIEVTSRERYGEMELDAKVELIRSLIPLGLMHVPGGVGQGGPRACR